MSSALGQTHKEVMVQGRILRGEDFDEYCEKNGMCTNCGIVQVKEPKWSGFGRSWKPVEIKTNDEGDVIVYKGYCIGPRCYSMKQAKQELGEILKKKIRTIRKPPPNIREPWETEFGHTEFGHDDSADIINAEISRSFDETQASGGSQDNQTKSISSSSTETPPSSAMQSESAVSNLTDLKDSRKAPAKDRRTSLNKDSRLNDAHARSPFLDETIPDAGRRKDYTSAYNVTANEAQSHRQRLVKSSGDVSRGSPSHVSPGADFHSSLPARLPATLEESPEEALQAALNRLDMYTFLVQLDCHRANSAVLQQGLQLLRQLVYKKHQADPDLKYVFPQDSWCKTIKSALTDFEHDLMVQEEAIKTVLFMSNFSPRYRSDLYLNHIAKELVAAMERHHAVEEMCCMALESLSRVKFTNVPWQEEHLVLIFDEFASLLSDPDRSGKEWAVLALYNISCDEKLSELFMDESMRRILVRPQVRKSLVYIIKDENVAENVVKAAVLLLWQYWASPSSFGIESMENSSTVWESDELLGALVGTMYNNNFTSESLHEQICGLLSSLEIPVCADPEGISWKETLSDVLCNCMALHTSVQSVQLAALKALCNIFGDPIRRGEYVTNLDTIVQAIILAMNNFDGNVDLQARGCQALACICTGGDIYRATVAGKGGIEAIAIALRDHVVNVDSTVMPSPDIDDLKEAASAALASLALSDTAIPVLQESDLLLDFQTIIERDGIPPEGSCTRACVINFIAISLLVPEDDSSRSNDANPDVIEVGYIILAKLAMQLILQTGNESEVSTLFGSLYVITCRAMGALDFILSAAGGTGLTRLVNLMPKFPENVSIQESGCGILANVYFRCPFAGELEQTSDIFFRSELFSVSTHSAQEVVVLRSALVKHNTQVGVVKNACSALCNFVSGLTVAVIDPEGIQVEEAAALLYSGLIVEANHVMSIHEDDPDAQRSALILLQVCLKLVDSDELQRLSGILIPKIYEAMNRFPQDPELHEVACIVLARFASSENNSIDDSLGNADAMGALLHSLQLQKDTVIERAISIISTLLERVYTLSNEIIEIEGYFRSLIDCMQRFPDSTAICAGVCSILATVASLNDDYVKTMIASQGGVTAVLRIMESQRGNGYIQECACKALSGIAEGITDEILVDVNAHIYRELIWALDYPAYANDECTQLATLEALCACCERECGDSRYLQGMSSYVKAMTRHLESKDLQKAGCKLFWLLARQNDENKRKIAENEGVGAVLNAMLSHVTSTAIQKEALTALKHLSQISWNKVLLVELGAESVIRLSIWGNLEDPSVLSAALSALNDISVNKDLHEVAEVSSEVLSCVFRAMRTHPDNCDVQKIGCWLLRSYTYNFDNIRAMRAEQEELFELLTVASAAFPDECSELVQKIFEKLSRRS